MYSVDLIGKCPSRAQVKKEIVKGLKMDNWVEVVWGENRVLVEKFFSPTLPRLIGSGWIRKTSGDDLAKEIMKELA